MCHSPRWLGTATTGGLRMLRHMRYDPHTPERGSQAVAAGSRARIPNFLDDYMCLPNVICTDRQTTRAPTPSLLPLPDRLLTNAGTSVPGYAEPPRPSKKNMCDRA